MSWENTKSGYGSLAILLHWLMLVLIVAGYAAMDLKSLSHAAAEVAATLTTLHASKLWLCAAVLAPAAALAQHAVPAFG